MLTAPEDLPGSAHFQVAHGDGVSGTELGVFRNYFQPFNARFGGLAFLTEKVSICPL